VENTNEIFGMPWPDALQVISSRFTLMQRAIYECACAGCKSIWVAVEPEYFDLYKHFVKDSLEDPYNLLINKFQYGITKKAKMEIPIYFTPTMPKDVKARKSQAWSIITAARSANRIFATIAEESKPLRFYVAFTNGIYNEDALLHDRPLLCAKSPFHFSFQKKTFKDDLPLGFTFTQDELKEAIKYVRVNSTGLYRIKDEYLNNNDPSLPSREKLERISKEDRIDAKKLTVSEVFNHVDLSGERYYSLDWLYDIREYEDWDKYIVSKKKKKYYWKLFKQARIEKIGENIEQ